MLALPVKCLIAFYNLLDERIFIKPGVCRRLPGSAPRILLGGGALPRQECKTVLESLCTLSKVSNHLL